MPVATTDQPAVLHHPECLCSPVWFFTQLPGLSARVQRCHLTCCTVLQSRTVPAGAGGAAPAGTAAARRPMHARAIVIFFICKSSRRQDCRNCDGRSLPTILGAILPLPISARADQYQLMDAISVI